MALIQETVIGKIEVNEDGSLSVRKDTVTKDNVTGNEIAGRTFHRHIVRPVDDVSGEDPKIQAIASVIFTDAVKAAWSAKNG